MEKKNGLGEYERALLQAIFNDEKLNSHFHAYDADGDPYSQMGEFHFILDS
jgi:hypothetical protein